jgi:hypothetical protein
MIGRVPFRGPARIVTDRDRQSGLVGQLLQFPLPQPRPATVAAAAVGFDEKVSLSGVLSVAESHPPIANRTHGEFRSVGTRPDADVAPIVRHIVDAVGDGPALGVARKIMSVDHVRLGAPPRAFVTEVSDQFGVLRVDADHGRPVPLKEGAHATQKTKLPIAVRMRRSGQPLDVGSERIARLLQQASNRAITDAAQPVGQRPQRTFDVSAAARRVAASFRFNQGFQVPLDFRVLFSTGGRPAPSRRTRSEGHRSRSLSNSVPPVRTVFGSRPVTSEANASPPQPTALESNAATQRRSFSAKRPNTNRTFSCHASSVDKFRVRCPAHTRTSCMTGLLHPWVKPASYKPHTNFRKEIFPSY